MGVQSTALYYMSSMGQLPRADAAIFIDTGREKRGTMRYLDHLQQWQLQNDGVPLIIVNRKNLFEDLLNGRNSRGKRFSSIPAYTRTEGSNKEGMLLRQCTGEYKIQQVDWAIREFLQAQSLRGYEIEVWKGITIDEWDRMANPEELWKVHVYPFTGYLVTRDGNGLLNDGRRRLMTRQDVVAWYGVHNLPVPPKSSCVFCPYQSDAAWAAMKENEPEDFADAVRVDYAIRDSTKKGIKQRVFLHDSLQPLDQVNFDRGGDLWKGECSGNCHI